MNRNLLLIISLLFVVYGKAQTPSTNGLNTSPGSPCSIRVYAQGQSPSVCKGGIVNLKALVTDESGTVKYKWSNGYELAYWAAVGLDVTSTYTVTVTDAANCSATSSVTITVKDPPQINFSARKVAICSGTPVKITAVANGGTPGYKYVWGPISGLENPLAGSTWASTKKNTSYSVTVTDNQGCTVSDALDVIVTETPQVSVSPALNEICVGTTAKLTANVSDKGLIATYKWSGGHSTPSIDVSPSAKITYTVTVTDTLNCTATASALVTVNAYPTVSIAPLKINICADSTVKLLALPKGGVIPYNYSWSNELGNEATVKAHPAASTAYVITVTDSKNCSASAQINVTVNAVIGAGISTASETVCLGAKTLLNAKGTGGNSTYTYKWGHVNTTSASVFVQPSVPATYKVTVTDVSSLHCSASASIAISLRDTAHKPQSIVKSPAEGLAADNTATLAIYQGDLGKGNSAAHWVWYAGSVNKGLAIDSFKNTVTVSPKTTTNYYVRAEGGCNITTPVSKLITLLKPINTAAEPAPGKKIVIKEPVVVKAITKEPVADKPVVKETVVVKPPVKEQPVVAKEPVVKETVVKKAPDVVHKDTVAAKPVAQPTNDIATTPAPVKHDTIHHAPVQPENIPDVAEPVAAHELKQQAAEVLYKLLNKYTLTGTLKPIDPSAMATKKSAESYKALFELGALTLDELRPTTAGAPSTQFNAKPIEKYIDDMVAAFPRGLIVSIINASIDYSGVMNKQAADIYIEKIVSGFTAKPNAAGTNLYKSHLFEVLHVRFNKTFTEAFIAKTSLVKGNLACLDCETETAPAAKEKLLHK